MSVILWLRRQSSASDLSLCDGIRKDAFQWFKVNINILKVNRAGRQVFCFSSREHPPGNVALHICPPPPPGTSCHQLLNGREQRPTNSGCNGNLWWTHRRLAVDRSWSPSPGRQLVTQHLWVLWNFQHPCGPQIQKVLSSRQWHPHPVGHTSWVRNHSIMWLVWPPCPQVRQKLDDPRTATWQTAH